MGQTTCDDACDANDDGEFDIGDPIYSFSYFAGEGRMPDPPFGMCGLDLSGDSLDCVLFTECP